MSIVKLISQWFRQLATLPQEDQVMSTMEPEPRRRLPDLECFKNSLRYSLGDAIKGKSLRQIDGGDFLCSAPLEELRDEKMPLLTDLIIDLELNPPRWTRLWFELEFVRVNRVELTAIYRATCDLIDGE